MSKPREEKPAHDDTLHVHLPAQPRKRPRQARSVVLVDALKKAGTDILEKEGRAALTAMHLSDRSGVAASSIYEYFPTMESLVAAIFHDGLTDARRRLIEEIRALPPHAKLFDGIVLMTRIGCAVLHKWSQIDPEASVRAMHYDELVRLDLIKSGELWSGIATPALLERFSSEIVVRDREKALSLFYQAIRALPRAIMLEKPSYLGEPDTPVLLARMLHALLTARHE